MRIRMTEDRRGTQDGRHVQLFLAGKEYEVRPHLAYAFYAAGCAVSVRHSKEAVAEKPLVVGR